MNISDFKAVLARLIGNSNILSNNVLFIQYCQGSHAKAQFLSQLYYWQSKAKRKDGYFYKTYEEWFTEIYVQKHSLMRYAKEFKADGFLATKIKKANGFPTVHYKLDTDALIASLVAFCNNGKEHFATMESDNLQLSEDNDNLQLCNNRDYHKLPTDIIAPAKPDAVLATKKSKKFDSAYTQVREQFEIAHRRYHEPKARANSMDYIAISWAAAKERNGADTIAKELRRMLSVKMAMDQKDITDDQIGKAAAAVFKKIEECGDAFTLSRYTAAQFASSWNSITNQIQSGRVEPKSQKNGKQAATIEQRRESLIGAAELLKQRREARSGNFGV